MNALEEGIFDALAANGALTAVVPSARMYRGAAPQGATLPYLVIMLQGGGDDNMTPVDSFDELYQVRAVSGLSVDEAGDIDDLIRPVLHKATLTIAGWTNYWTRRETEIRVTETDSAEGGTGVRRFHAGGLYRIRGDK